MNTFKLGFGRISMVLIAAILLLFGCKKNGNPNDLPAPGSAASYMGSHEEGVVKILAIGNSFSENAVESYLDDLARGVGEKVIIGNMYIGGASLGLHRHNAENNASIYEYRKINTDGVNRRFSKVSIATALGDENWDYISFQQSSPLSGLLDSTRDDLLALYNYVSSRVSNPDVKYIYHQTWAYAPVTTNAGFANYGNDQSVMYNGIVNVSENVSQIVPFDIIVPAGTAVQDARSSILGESFTAGDGYHLNELGKYLAACTWFESIFGHSAVGTPFTPAGFSDFENKVAQSAAHLAVQSPNQISSMADYQVEPGPLMTPVLVDFGNATPSASWNQLASYTVGSKLNLKDSLNAFVGISISVTERFNAINTNGATVTTTPLNMPSNVSSRSFYGNSRGPLFGGVVTPRGVFELTGLVKDLTYNFCFFGSRSASDNRETVYTVSGTNTSSASLNAASNATEIACVSNIQPDDNGKISITVTSGPNNLTTNGWFYINAMRITSNN